MPIGNSLTLCLRCIPWHVDLSSIPRGYFDLSIRDDLLSGGLKEFLYLEEKVEWAIAELPKISSR
jgi:hypothetical protein